ncbi:MAG: DNA primase, partial [Sedimentisphaerales bacterium]|nr:DNA primase [Sedimentisphaerales bacterium]
MPTYFEDRHIAEILQATDIVSLVGTYMALKQQGKDFVGLCPFHNDRRPSMYVSPSKQLFKCFSCGAGGDVIKFIMLKERMTFPESVKYLAERANIILPERTGKVASPAGEYDRNALEQVNRWAAKYYRCQYDDEQEGQIARDYIASRGISEATSRKFGLGWAGKGWDNLVNAARADNIDLKALHKLGLVIEKDSGGYYDRFRERVMFPVLDSLKRVIAFGGRTLAGDPAKYMNSPESELFDKSSNLYGLHAAKDAIVAEKAAIVVEGYTDCIMAHQRGVCNVVAT